MKDEAQIRNRLIGVVGPTEKGFEFAKPLNK
jgi:hypothetical protein